MGKISLKSSYSILFIRCSVAWRISSILSLAVLAFVWWGWCDGGVEDGTDFTWCVGFWKSQKKKKSSWPPTQISNMSNTLFSPSLAESTLYLKEWLYLSSARSSLCVLKYSRSFKYNVLSSIDGETFVYANVAVSKDMKGKSILRGATTLKVVKCIC